MKVKDEQIAKLLKEKFVLEAKILGEDAPLLQYKFLIFFAGTACFIHDGTKAKH